MKQGVFRYLQRLSKASGVAAMPVTIVIVFLLLLYRPGYIPISSGLESAMSIEYPIEVANNGRAFVEITNASPLNQLTLLSLS